MIDLIDRERRRGGFDEVSARRVGRHMGCAHQVTKRTLAIRLRLIVQEPVDIVLSQILRGDRRVGAYSKKTAAFLRGHRREQLAFAGGEPAG